MSFQHSFPDVVYTAIGSSVPCLEPFVGITMLQLLSEDSFKPRRGCFIRWLSRRLSGLRPFCPSDYDEILINPGNNVGNLITIVKDDKIEQKLENILESVKSEQVWLLMSITEGWRRVVPLDDSDLARVGLIGIHDKRWNLSYGKLMRKSFPTLMLRKLIEHNSGITDELRESRVVTAIFFTNGGLTFSGHEANVTKTRCINPSAETLPVDIAPGWQCTKDHTTGYITLAETNPLERVIAIEYILIPKGQTVAA